MSDRRYYYEDEYYDDDFFLSEDNEDDDTCESDDYDEDDYYDEEDYDEEYEPPRRPFPRHRSRVRRHKHRRISILKCILCLFLSCVIIFVSAVYYFLGSMNRIPLNRTWEDYISEDAPDWDLQDSIRYYNILLIGLDGSGESGSRSDTMLIMSIDRLKQRIRLVSFLRDMYVEIPDHGYNRLNAAYAFGGIELTIRTFESNFRIKLDNYLQVDFSAFEKIIDTLGGITMEITESEANQINKHAENGTGTLTAGVQLLNGSEGLHYARIRRIDSDFERTNRQRKVIKQILDQCKKEDPVTLCKLIGAVSPCITTNMNRSQLVAFFIQLFFCAGKDIEDVSVPAKGEYQSKTVNSMSVLVPELKDNCEIIFEFLFGKTPDDSLLSSLIDKLA